MLKLNPNLNYHEHIYTENISLMIVIDIVLCITTQLIILFLNWSVFESLHQINSFFNFYYKFCYRALKLLLNDRFIKLFYFFSNRNGGTYLYFV